MSAAQRLSFRWCAAASLGAGVVFALYASTLAYPLDRELWLIRATGYTALATLFLSLSTSPLLRLAQHVLPAWARTATWRAFRRSLGMTSAWWALLHAGLTLTTYLWDSWPAVVSWAYLRAGLVAAVILALLLLTSFPRMVAFLEIKLWKQLHRLAYVAAVFLFQHLMLSPFASRGLVLWLFAGLLVVGLLRLLPSPGRRGGKAEASAVG